MIFEQWINPRAELEVDVVERRKQIEVKHATSKSVKDSARITNHRLRIDRATPM